MNSTGVFCTDEERKRFHEMAKSASGPVLFISGGQRIGNTWQDVHKALYQSALAHGLPEITGYYGLTQEGEFVTS